MPNTPPQTLKFDYRPDRPPAPRRSLGTGLHARSQVGARRHWSSRVRWVRQVGQASRAAFPSSRERLSECLAAVPEAMRVRPRLVRYGGACRPRGTVAKYRMALSVTQTSTAANPHEPGAAAAWPINQRNVA